MPFREEGSGLVADHVRRHLQVTGAIANPVSGIDHKSWIEGSYRVNPSVQMP